MEINDIQNAISVKLHKAFGEAYKKYIDEVGTDPNRYRQIKKASSIEIRV